MPTRSIIYFHIKPGMEAAFARRFQELRILETAQGQPGWLGGELCRAADGSPVFTVTALWQSPDAYRAWRERPRPTTGPGGIQEFCDEITEGKAYQLVHHVGPPERAG